MSFGIKAENIRCFVTQEPKTYSKLAKIPVSVGFKQFDGTYYNQFFTILLFKDMIPLADKVKKGDRIEVTGNVTVNFWKSPNGEEHVQWQIMANELNGVGQSGVANAPSAADPGDVPF